MNRENSVSVPFETVEKSKNQRRSARRRKDTVSQALRRFDDMTRGLPLSRTYRARCRDLIRESARPSVTARKLADGACKGPPPDRDLHLSDVQEILVALWRKWGADVYPVPFERELKALERAILNGRLARVEFVRKRRNLLRRRPQRKSSN